MAKSSLLSVWYLVLKRIIFPENKQQGINQLQVTLFDY